jgi:hypothetical protein
MAMIPLFAYAYFRFGNAPHYTITVITGEKFSEILRMSEHT